MYSKASSLHFESQLYYPYYLLYLSWTQVFSGLETIQEEYGTILDSSTHVLPEKHDSVRFCSPYQKWEANEKESRGKALVPFLVYIRYPCKT